MPAFCSNNDKGSKTPQRRFDDQSYSGILRSSAINTFEDIAQKSWATMGLFLISSSSVINTTWFLRILLQYLTSKLKQKLELRCYKHCKSVVTNNANRHQKLRTHPKILAWWGLPDSKYVLPSSQLLLYKLSHGVLYNWRGIDSKTKFLT